MLHPLGLLQEKSTNLVHTLHPHSSRPALHLYVILAEARSQHLNRRSEDHEALALRRFLLKLLLLHCLHGSKTNKRGPRHPRTLLHRVLESADPLSTSKGVRACLYLPVLRRLLAKSGHQMIALVRVPSRQLAPNFKLCLRALMSSGPTRHQGIQSLQILHRALRNA
jgi:hypothetical protein